MLKLLEEHNFVKSVEQTSHRLETINRELFLPTDPDLTTFQQGRLGDCYLLSVIAALLHRSPNVIREMIHPEVTGGFQVVFGDGQKIQVAPLTDSELLLGAKLDNRHGSWLAVLEKAYGIIRKRDREKEAKRVAPASSTVPVETLDSGDPGVIISLMTGHHAESLRLGKAADANQVHNLLTEMAKGKRLMCASANNKEKPPPGMVNRHIYAILGYDAKKRQLTIFNPWGNSFNPKGPPGLENGYATKSGEFTVPLDQFEKVFSVVVYETDRWLPK